MKAILKLGLIAFASIILLISCAPNYNAPDNKDMSQFTINGVTKYGNLVEDASLKAYTIPCQDNSTFRMYVSDSALSLGLPSQLKIVSYQKAGKLAYNEVYLEVSSSADDTYLSTGDDAMVIAWDATKATNISANVQHFTGMPLNEFTKVEAILKPH